MLYQAVSSLHEDIDFFLLVRLNFQPDVGDADTFQSRNQFRDEAKNIGLLVHCPKEYNVILLKFGVGGNRWAGMDSGLPA